jgi:hypothetical protein
LKNPFFVEKKRCESGGTFCGQSRDAHATAKKRKSFYFSRRLASCDFAREKFFENFEEKYCALKNFFFKIIPVKKTRGVEMFFTEVFRAYKRTVRKWIFSFDARKRSRKKNCACKSKTPMYTEPGFQSTIVKFGQSLAAEMGQE